MVIFNFPLSWHVSKLKNNEPYSYGMFGDGEWSFMLGTSTATQHGCLSNGEDLRKSLKFKSDNYYFATASVLKNAAWTGIGEKAMDDLCAREEVEIEWHEKDMFDAEMKKGNLGPLIEELRKKSVCIIGNQMLEGLTFLNPRKVIGLDFPNWYLGEGMDKVVEQANQERFEVYLIAGGPGSAILTQRLHGNSSFNLHFGSIWDGFVGMGSMRGFRAELYADPVKYNEWAMSNLKGIVEDWSFPTTFNP